MDVLLVAEYQVNLLFLVYVHSRKRTVYELAFLYTNCYKLSEILRPEFHLFDIRSCFNHTLCDCFLKGSRVPIYTRFFSLPLQNDSSKDFTVLCLHRFQSNICSSPNVPCFFCEEKQKDKMGNARGQEGRLGNPRPGPSVRNRGAQAEAGPSINRDGEGHMAVEHDEVLHDVRDATRREYDRTRQAATRRRRAEEEAEAVQNAQRRTDRDEVLNQKQITAVSRRVVNFIANELRTCCSGPLNRCTVMERVLGSPLVFPHLPAYYLRPTEAKVNTQLLQNLRQELSQVKGSHSAEMLAYKSALLNVVVGGIGSGETTLYSRLLQTNINNIRKASQRRQSLQSSGASLWGLRTRRPRSDQLPKITVDTVNDWWSKETRVSPVAKEVTRRWLAPKEYEVHPTHYLCETQVFALYAFLLSMHQ